MASAIVLAGGRSLRMGKDKTQLPWGQYTLLEQAVRRLRYLTDDILVVEGAFPSRKLQGARSVLDRYAGRGPLGGIHAGLLEAKYEAVFVLSCDMPFVTVELASFLLTKLDGFSAVTPKYGGRVEPLCSVYSRECLGVIETLLQSENNQVRKIFSKVKTCYVEEAELQFFGDMNHLFFNLNTPEDWQEALYRKRQGYGDFDIPVFNSWQGNK